MFVGRSLSLSPPPRPTRLYIHVSTLHTPTITVIDRHTSVCRSVSPRLPLGLSPRASSRRETASPASPCPGPAAAGVSSTSASLSVKRRPYDQIRSSSADHHQQINSGATLQPRKQTNRSLPCFMDNMLTPISERRPPPGPQCILLYRYMAHLCGMQVAVF